MHNRKLTALLLAAGSMVFFVLLFMGLSQIKPVIPHSVERYTHGIIGTIAALATIWIFLKIEKSTWRTYGLYWEGKTIRRFAIGTAIGIGLALAMIFFQVWYSGLEVMPSDTQGIASFLIWVPAIIILAFMEELAFRSYAFIKLDNAFGLRTAQLVTAILFALYHVAMGWPVGLSFMGPGIWALAYGLSAAASGGIAMPTGLHSGVNIILALFVGKQNIESVWVIDYPAAVTEEMMQMNELTGVVIHITLLAACVAATEVYVRKRKRAGEGAI